MHESGKGKKGDVLAKKKFEGFLNAIMAHLRNVHNDN